MKKNNRKVFTRLFVGWGMTLCLLTACGINPDQDSNAVISQSAAGLSSSTVATSESDNEEISDNESSIKPEGSNPTSKSNASTVRTKDSGSANASNYSGSSSSLKRTTPALRSSSSSGKSSYTPKYNETDGYDDPDDFADDWADEYADEYDNYDDALDDAYDIWDEEHDD